jgi:hypothetical protein
MASRSLLAVSVLLLVSLSLGATTYAAVTITRGPDGHPVYSIQTGSVPLPVSTNTGATGWYDASALNTTGTLSSFLFCANVDTQGGQSSLSV